MFLTKIGKTVSFLSDSTLLKVGTFSFLLTAMAPLWNLPAFGQEETEPAAETTAELPEQEAETETAEAPSGVERIEVTGSRIKRIDIEGPSPILILDREYLDRSGYNSVADVLRETTSASFGAARESAGVSSADVATVGIRGLGASRTLVLLNGRRLPPDALDQAVDLNIIPMAAVERIDILRDGASAIYGSDAIGGVINIITKKNYNGVEAFAKYSMPQEEGGVEEEINVVGGSSGSKGSVMAVARYNKKHALMARDRWWTYQGESVFSNPGNYLDPDSFALLKDPSNTCAPDLVRTEGSDNYCAYRYSEVATNIPEITHYNALVESEWKVNSNLSLFGRVIGGYKDIYWQYAPTPSSGLVVNGSALTEGGAGDNLPATLNGKQVNVFYRFTDVGNRENSTTNLNYGTYAGARGYVGATSWDWEASVGFNRVEREENGKGYLRESLIVNAVNNNNYNPFATGNKGDISSALTETYTKTFSSIYSFEAQATGEVFDMAAGPASTAIGVAHFGTNYKVEIDDHSIAQDVIGSGGTAGRGNREVYSAYNEWSLPVMSNMELQLAARFDHYNDFGDTVNPKVGVRYNPMQSLMFRGSVGTAFLAPSLDDLYKTTTFGFPTFIDEVACANEGGSSCSGRQYEVVSSGNPNLEEEKALTASLGTLFQPNADFNVGFDVWYVKMDNVVGLDLNAVTEAERQFGSAYVQGKGITVTRLGNGRIDRIVAPALNLQAREITGLDVEANYTLPFMFMGHRFMLKDEYSYIYEYKQERFPGLGKEDIIGDAGLPQWKNNFTFLIVSDLQEFSATARTISKMEKASADAGELPDYTEYDVNYSRELPWNGTVSAGVKNVFGSTPPIDETAGPGQGLDASVYNPLGRVYYLGYRQAF